LANQIPGHRIKLDRATNHLHALDRAIKGLLDYEPYYIGTKFDAESGDYVFWLESHEEPTADFSAIISDVLFNLRSALDHLVYALNVKGGLSNPKTSEFPIHQTVRNFTDSIPKQIPKVGGSGASSYRGPATIPRRDERSPLEAQ
jgi:hypothetical protein